MLIAAMLLNVPFAPLETISLLAFAELKKTFLYIFGITSSLRLS